MQLIVVGYLNQSAISECIEPEKSVNHTQIAEQYAKKGWSNVVIFDSKTTPALLQSIGELHQFTIPTALYDAGDSNNEQRYSIDKSNHMLSLQFDGHTDYCGSESDSSQLNVDFFDGDVNVYIYSDCLIEEPTHTVTLTDARIERQQDSI